MASEQGTTRRLSFFVGALDALFVLAMSLGALLVGSTIVWAAEYQASTSWLDAAKGALNIWYLAHGVDLHFAASKVAGLEIPAWNFALAPLGLVLIVAVLARRTAHRVAQTSELWPAWTGAIIAYWAVAFALAPLAASASAAPVSAQAVFLPPLVYGACLILASLVYHGPRTAVPLAQAREKRAIRNWLSGFSSRGWFVSSISAPVLRAGTAVVAALLGVSAVVISVLLVFNWITVISLFEALRVTILGGLTLTIGQIAVMPNLVVFGAAWLTGTGFSIGTGSHVSPLGTELGPVPTVPVFAAIPTGDLTFGLAAICVPVLIAFIATLAIKKHAEAVRFNFASPLAAALSVGIGVGVVAGIELGILGALASGSIGPDRLGFFGVNPWMLALVTFIEVAPAATLAAFYSTRPQKASPIPEHLKR